MADHVQLLNPTWPDLESFYAEDDRRRFSPEHDFGVHWCMEDRAATFRLSRLEATGEVIMVHNRTTWTELVGWTPDRVSLEKVLKDWQHQYGPKSYYWVRQRFLLASGHRGAAVRKDNVHAGSEVTDSLRDQITEPTSLF